MSSLITSQSQFQLSKEKLDQVLKDIKLYLYGKVKKAYIFGSSSTGEFHKDSDIDLILIVEKTKTPFIERGLEFSYLFEIYPDIDILVYTQEEFDRQLEDSALGFWKSVRESLKQIV